MDERTPRDATGISAHEALADELLAIRCQLGEREAFDALIARWHRPLWLYLRRLADGEDEAADVLQDVWLRVLRAMPGLRDPARLRAWLFGIARRTAMDRLRRRYAEPEPVPIDEVELPDGDGSDELDRDLAEELAVLQDALAAMPLVEREVLVLFYLRELTLEQIAEVLGVPVGTVKSRLHRARRLMRRQLTDMGVQR